MQYEQNDSDNYQSVDPSAGLWEAWMNISAEKA
jgi:hypothetical protein